MRGRFGGLVGFGEERVFGVVCWVFAMYSLAAWGADNSSNAVVVLFKLVIVERRNEKR